MPTNIIEELLSDTADFCQSRIKEDRVLREALRAALEADQRPSVVRLLGPEMPLSGCLIQIVPTVE